MSVTFNDIKRAQETIKGHVVRTPLLHSHALSEITGAEIHVKLENMQATSSFKDRGALVKLTSLSEAEKQRGIIAMSAGNHAQSVSFHARNMGIDTTIVMPLATPYNKIERTKRLGARVILSGETVAESQEKVEQLVASEGLTQVHPYDDDKVIAGQGTVAAEILEDIPDLDILVAPIGGGGLMSGCAIAAKHMRPEIKIIGSEALLYPSMYHALRGEKSHCGGATLAEGIAVKDVSKRTVSYCKPLVDEIKLVDEQQIERAVHLFLTGQKTLAEGASATALAAVMSDREQLAGKKVALVLTGGNIDPRILASISYRELEREQRLIKMRIAVDDRPGMLGIISTLVGKMGANILEVSHHRMFLDISAKGAQLEIMLETRDGVHATEIVKKIEEHGFSTTVLGSFGHGKGGFNQ